MSHSCLCHIISDKHDLLHNIHRVFGLTFPSCPGRKKNKKKKLSSDFINSELTFSTSYPAEAALLTFNLQEAPIRKHKNMHGHSKDGQV